MSIEFAQGRLRQIEDAREYPDEAVALISDLADRLGTWQLLYQEVQALDRHDLLYHPSNQVERGSILRRLLQLLSEHKEPPFVCAMQVLMVCHREKTWLRELRDSEAMHAWVYLGLLLCQQRKQDRGANSAKVVSMMHSMIGHPAGSIEPYTKAWTSWVCRQLFGDIWCDFHGGDGESIDIALIIKDKPPLADSISEKSRSDMLSLPNFG
jgi:hypothetical protein